PVKDGGVIAHAHLTGRRLGQSLAEPLQEREFAAQRGLRRTVGGRDGPHARALPAEDPEGTMQGVIKSYDPGTGEGVVVRDTDRSEYALAANALEASIFRTLRQGQRVVFELDESQRA